MALVLTTDRKPIFLPADLAARLWRIHTGEEAGSPQLKAKVAQIAKWYLNPDTAPKSYRQYRSAAKEAKQRRLVDVRTLPYID